MAVGKYKVRKSIRKQSFVINLSFLFLIKPNVQKIYVSLNYLRVRLKMIY